MAPGMLFFALPLVLYLGLVLLPPGHRAISVCAAAGAVVGVIWLIYLFDPGGVMRQSGRQGAFSLLMLVGVTAAWGVASSLQLLRLRLPSNWPGWTWALIALATLIAATIPAIRLFGF